MSFELYLKQPTGQYRLIKCSTQELLLGSVTGAAGKQANGAPGELMNDLVLVDEQVAPQHLKIRFNHRNAVQIYDLGSEAGSFFLAPYRRLEPYQLETWETKKILVIGSHQLVWLWVEPSAHHAGQRLSAQEIADLFTKDGRQNRRARPVKRWLLYGLLGLIGLVLLGLLIWGVRPRASISAQDTASDNNPMIVAVTLTPTPSATATPTLSPTPLLQPTATPLPTPTVTPSPVVALDPTPALLPCASTNVLDETLRSLGVEVHSAQMPVGEYCWRLVEARWLAPEVSQGRHHIYVEVVDEANQRLVGQTVTVSWSSGAMHGETENKPAPEYAFNYPMDAAGHSYSLRVEGLPGDVITGIGLGTPEQRDFAIQTSFQFKFQRTLVAHD